MESIRKFFSAAAALAAGLIGTGVWGVFLFISLFSLPLNVIAIMRIKGWDWWPALIGAVVLGIVPLFGQIAFIVLAFVGAYFLIEAKFDWRKAIEPTPQTMAAPDEKPTRLRLCVNAEVSAYGNLQDRADKDLLWLRAHKEDFGRYIDEGDERWEGKFKSLFDAVDLDDPKFLDGFRWTFGVGHTAGCLEYEKQLATQAAFATSDALFDSCVHARLGMQVGGAMKELPDFELKQRQNFGDPKFVVGFSVGGQRGVADGCLLADALKRSGNADQRGNSGGVRRLARKAVLTIR